MTAGASVLGSANAFANEDRSMSKYAPKMIAGKKGNIADPPSAYQPADAATVPCALPSDDLPDGNDRCKSEHRDSDEGDDKVKPVHATSVLATRPLARRAPPRQL